MRFLYFLGLILCLSGCQPTIHIRGNFVDWEEAQKINVGQDTRAQVKARLGAPTFVQMFGGFQWYYIGERTKELAFFRPTIVERDIIVINFDAQGIVLSIGRQDNIKSFEFERVDRVTPTHGRDPSILKEVFGSVAVGDEGKVRKGMVAR